MMMSGDPRTGATRPVSSEGPSPRPASGSPAGPSSRSPAAAPGPSTQPPPAGVSPRPGWLSAELYPFTSRFVEIDGDLVHYIDEGEGPVLLFLHGNPTWSFLYRDIVAGLRDRFRCVALDYPGYGLSRARPGHGFTPGEQARVVEGFVSRLGLAGFVPVVHDWGGPIGLWVAGRHPELVRGLVVCNTWAWPSDDRVKRWFSAVMGGPLGRTLIRRFNVFVNVFVPRAMRTRRLDPEVLAAYRGPFPDPDTRTPMHVLPRHITAGHGFLREVETGLAALAAKPALVVWGEADIGFTAAARRRLEAAFPDHRTVLLPRAGHYLQEEDPAAVVRAVRAWWDERRP
ncbi:haloalkane dehalogenase [Sphaerisporangium rubeum]|uniref:Haloalkane dehalogenase n=1 Tax=Sphaerisporangium rubeum TaxID=321317 RepID=A0A7X0M7M5_9ACTN|nr:alpha/beta fold hydrolase [Sphaerisporangium rubeum]MBB6474948.1 haloalkane dehalogenase [Sphaerisporangium rubeum]